MNHAAGGAALQPQSPAARRGQLLMRSSALRLQIARDAQVLVTPLALADQVRAAVRWLRRHPEWPVGTLVLLAVLRPRRAWRWVTRAWWGWRMWRRAGRLLAAVAPRR